MSFVLSVDHLTILDMDTARLTHVARAAERLVRARNSDADAEIILAALGLS